MFCRAEAGRDSRLQTRLVELANASDAGEGESYAGRECWEWVRCSQSDHRRALSDAVDGGARVARDTTDMPPRRASNIPPTLSGLDGYSILSRCLSFSQNRGIVSALGQAVSNGACGLDSGAT